VYKLFLSLLLVLIFTLTACADVIAGPMIALYVGINFVIPIVLVIILIVVTVRLIRTVRRTKRRDEEDNR
jgi:uncharacterized membrane protein